MTRTERGRGGRGEGEKTWIRTSTRTMTEREGGRQNQDYDMERATRTRRRAETGKGRVENEEDNWTRRRSTKRGGGGREYFQLRTKTSFNRVLETWNRLSVDINFEAKSGKRISRSRKIHCFAMFPSYLIIWASSLSFIWGQYCFFFFFFFFNVQLDYPLNYNKYIKIHKIK